MTEDKFPTGHAMKRFGARYGRRVRSRLNKIETNQKATYKCPYCSYVRVKRVASGIWYCGKCNAKFTSKAYRVERSIKTRDATGVF